MSKFLWTFAFSLALVAAGCTVDDSSDADAGGGAQDAGPGADASGDDANVVSQCEELVDLPCEDTHYQQLSLHDKVSTGTVSTTTEGGAFVSVIDASAGGMNASTTNPFLYVKFGEDGLEKAEISDDDALVSGDWDLAARRFIVLLNGGDAGPSCVAATQASGDFASVTSAPASGYELEDFYDEGCTYIPDSRYDGFDSPDSVLKAWWEYDGCVQTSMQVFVLELASGRHVKLVIEAYYNTGQADCNSMGLMGSDSGWLTLRWAWL